MKNNRIDFINYLISQNMEVFTLAQVASFFGGINKAVYEFLADLEREGWLTKLNTGLYAKKPSQNKEEDFMPNWHKTAEAIVFPREYYIAYYSALQVHDLITQPAIREL